MVGRGSRRFQVLGSKFQVRPLILCLRDAPCRVERNLERKTYNVAPRTVREPRPTNRGQRPRFSAPGVLIDGVVPLVHVHPL
jgi:hypothetical protein